MKVNLKMKLDLAHLVFSALVVAGIVVGQFHFTWFPPALMWLVVAGAAVGWAFYANKKLLKDKPRRPRGRVRVGAANED